MSLDRQAACPLVPSVSAPVKWASLPTCEMGSLLVLSFFTLSTELPVSLRSAARDQWQNQRQGSHCLEMSE